VRNLCDLLNSEPQDINAFICDQLPPEKTQQLIQRLLVAGVPL
jgi:hypothetical protein